MGETMPYEYQEFPKWTHKDGEKSRVVNSREELDALGEGWSDAGENPYKVYVDGPDFHEFPKWVNGVLVQNAAEESALVRIEDAGAPADSDEREALIKIAAERNVKIDKRWSDDKIRAALVAA